AVAPDAGPRSGLDGAGRRARARAPRAGHRGAPRGDDPGLRGGDVAGARLLSLRFEGALALRDVEGRRALCATVRATAPLAMHPLFRVRIEGPGAAVAATSSDTNFVPWIPRGTYEIACFLPDTLAAGEWNATLEAVHKDGMAYAHVDTVTA